MDADFTLRRATKGDGVPVTVVSLGYAGLIPFCTLLLLRSIDPQRSTIYGEAVASYSLAIICFLVGAWWGLALIRRNPSALILSNAVVTAAVLGHAMLPTPSFFLLSASLFAATLLVERSGAVFRPQPVYYTKLRLRLSVVASATLIWAWTQA